MCRLMVLAAKEEHLQVLVSLVLSCRSLWSGFKWKSQDKQLLRAASTTASVASAHSQVKKEKKRKPQGFSGFNHLKDTIAKSLV